MTGGFCLGKSKGVGCQKESGGGRLAEGVSRPRSIPLWWRHRIRLRFIRNCRFFGGVRLLFRGKGFRLGRKCSLCARRTHFLYGNLDIA